MENEKLKTYNRRVIAALVSVLLIMAIIGLIVMVFTISKPLFPDKKPRINTLLSDEKVENLKSDSLRQQIISYQSPYLIDTLNLIYLIPVDVKTLEKLEKTDREITSVKKERMAYEVYNEANFEGSFSNLIVYDYKNNSTQKVCNSRMIGMNLKIKSFDDEILLVFSGADTDSNKDEIVNYLDFKSLFIYSLKEKKLQKFGIKNSSVSAFDFVENKKDILVTWKYDRDTDNEFDQETEPTFVTRYDHTQKSMAPIIDSKLEKEIQKIIDKS